MKTRRKLSKIEKKRSSLYVLKKGEKLGVKRFLIKKMDFVDRETREHLHNRIQTGVSRSVFQEHLWSKYEKNIARKWNPNNTLTKTQLRLRFRKEIDNMLRTMKGERGSGKGEPIIFFSEKKYGDPKRGFNHKVRWIAYDQKTADLAGKMHEKRIKSS
ncbi:hypothetical protein K8R43_01660 [archaeon]|nr:hypothetical protein [archaeon]